MVQSRSGRSDQIELDAFGAFARGLWVRDVVSVEGRLEDRAYRVEGDEVKEIRCVADRIEVLDHAP
jgi:hypothetical protein